VCGVRAAPSPMLQHAHLATTRLSPPPPPPPPPPRPPPCWPVDELGNACACQHQEQALDNVIAVSSQLKKRIRHSSDAAEVHSYASVHSGRRMDFLCRIPISFFLHKCRRNASVSTCCVCKMRPARFSACIKEEENESASW